KKDELDALWRDPAATSSPKCKDFVAKNFSHLIGADAVAGSKNLLVLLRGPRLGELVVVDAKTLAEKKTIKMPWCEGSSADKASTASPPAAAPAADTAPEKPAKKAKAAKPNAKDDPDSGQ